MQKIRKVAQNGSDRVSSRSNSHKTRNSFALDEDIGDEVEGELDDPDVSGSDSDSQQENETAEDKRIRIAKEYLETMRRLDEEGSDQGSEDGNTNFAGKLKRHRLESLGTYYQNIADNVPDNIISSGYELKSMSLHKGPVTCVVLSNCGSKCFSGSKDNSLILWDLALNSKKYLLPSWNRKSHPNKQSWEGEVLAVAISSDDRFLVCGGKDKIIRVFDSKVAYGQVHELKGHKDAISSLAFQRGTYSLFSGSLDRCLKHWDIGEMGYIETLFGHQDAVQAVDCLHKPRPVSCGSDRSVRLWKVLEESHLVFRGHKAAADCVAQLTETCFASGGQDGTLQLWKDTHKTPFLSVPAAHGWQEDAREGALRNPRWLSSLRAVPMSDLLVSGSYDGSVRLWKASLEEGKGQLRQVGQLPVEGFVNGIAVSPNKLAVATGSEHRLGRWWHVKGNRNKVLIFTFNKSLS